jgi:hypothetical protein
MRKDGMMSIRVPKALKAEIKRQAEEARRTIPNQVLVIMELGLREIEKAEKRETAPEEARA